jgi:uncharacterized membrane protein YeaQ/YmgE (transglycosylase-associated protein family)
MGEQGDRVWDIIEKVGVCMLTTARARVMRDASKIAEVWRKTDEVSQMGPVMNIVLGIIGAAVASWLFGLLGITFGGWIGYLIAGFIEACILIAIARILNAHPSDQRLQIGIDLRPAAQGARFPAPIAAKAGTMPAHKRLGPDDRHHLED